MRTDEELKKLRNRLDGQRDCSLCGPNVYADGDHLTRAHCKILNLESENERLKKRIGELGKRIGELGKRIGELEVRSND